MVINNTGNDIIFAILYNIYSLLGFLDALAYEWRFYQNLR